MPHSLLSRGKLLWSGEHWILYLEHQPPEMVAQPEWTYSMWMVSRRGGSFRQVLERQKRGVFFLDTFQHRDQSVLVLQRDTRPPELEAYQIEQE